MRLTRRAFLLSVCAAPLAACGYRPRRQSKFARLIAKVGADLAEFERGIRRVDRQIRALSWQLRATA